MKTSYKKFRAACIAAASAITLTAAVVTAPLLADAQTAPSLSRCTTNVLAIWTGVGNGMSAAGSTYYPIEFTNLSRTACVLGGYPGVSATLSGRQVGAAASRTAGSTSAVVLAPGSTVHATLKVTNVANYPAATCKPAQADALRVYAPGAIVAQSVPISIKGCSLSGPVYLSVTPVSAGVGVPGR